MDAPQPRVGSSATGVSGARSAIYAVASGRADRFVSVASLIADWAVKMDSALTQSAAETRSERHIRFVTNADCSLNIAHVVLSTTGTKTSATW